MQSLEDLLNSSGAAPQANPEPQAGVTEQPAPPEPETEEPSQEAAEPATGDDQEPPAQDDQAAPPAASQDEPLDKKISAFQRKAEDETRKRQDYEKQLADVRKQADEQARYIQQVQQYFAQQQQGNEQDEVDLYEPQQLQKYVGSILERERSAMSEQILQQKVVASQEILRSQHEDYDEHETIFADEMKRLEASGDESLRKRLNAHPFPAKFAYEEGKRLKLQQEMADPDAYKAKLEAELREKILAEQHQANPASQAPAQARPVPQPPKSLAGVPSSARDPIKHPWKGPTPLDQLLN